MNFLDNLKDEVNFTTTENGAVALESTKNKVLDAFATLGSMKNAPEETIIKTFNDAFLEDRALAMRLLFYIRDIRGGQGMRRVFRVIVKFLANNYPQLVVKNLDNFLFFGRGDDVLCLLDTPIKDKALKWIDLVIADDMNSLLEDGGQPSLLAKWLPSENASSKETKRYGAMVRKAMNISPKQYRKLLKTLRARINVVETLMSRNKWEQINFNKLPSRAAMIYSDAFMRHVQDNYVDYLQHLSVGRANINAKALFPVDIIHKVINKICWTPSLKDQYLLTALWEALPNYFEEREETGLCVVDVSGSMYGIPMEVAISLGMYCADKAKGPFKNHFITFSQNPKLVEIKGDNIFEKVRCMSRSDWGMNTNLEKVFDLILDTAVHNHMTQEDLPSKLYIISDMQFDAAQTTIRWEGNIKPKPFMETMKLKYAEAGYTMPAIVYWNVRNSDCGMFQSTFEGENCAMVSGYSPSLFKAILDGTEFETETIIKDGKEVKVEKQKLDPMNVMLTTLMNERYNRVITK